MMAIPVLIMGESGTGKSASLRRLPCDLSAVVSVQGKRLPFREPLDVVTCSSIPDMIKPDGTTEAGIQTLALRANRPIVVLDDFGYTITDLYMRLTYGPEKLRDQYEPYKIIGSQVYGLINAIQRDGGGVNAEKIVYMVMHTDTNAQGHVIPATVGKMLNEKINLVGMFTICLLSCTDGENYRFITNGKPPAKSPDGMFSDTEVPNDLKAVDDAIREYWGMAPLAAPQGMVVSEPVYEVG